MKGAFLSFFSTHLALKEEELQVSISEVLNITEKSRFPKIITGDFNVPPAHQQIARMKERYTDVFLQLDKGDNHTYPSVYENPETGEKIEPVTRIDYIFADDHVEAESGAVIKTSVSDHLPITAELILTKTVHSANPLVLNEV